ncbi:hypothetical protein SAMN06265379_108146 [Saccharicrinis carchari]|uniref:Uncharacterized protein n=1 Tax=Saccharicrinis carchari TaxID=1168039 RepID=A0A521EDC8_SACCC|nr:hypothetical protein [Saccharicrinis carchari]SMO81918.1 hypothetical protein SAMN06265379_108146 [Saccharicrinis carchari]
MNTSERILVHGPGMMDITDLFYFDKIVYPVVEAYLRPPELAPGYVGYKAQEFIPQDILEKLKDAGLIVTPAEVLLVPDSSELINTFKEGGDVFKNWGQDKAEKYGSALFQICTLVPPLNDSNVSKWLQDIDKKTRDTTKLIEEQKIDAVTKLYRENITSVLTPGWDTVLSLLLPLPCVAPGMPHMDAIIAFLKDNTTIQKRTSLFNWHRDITLNDESNSSLTEKITDILLPRLKTYMQWLKDSGLVVGLRETEFLISLGKSMGNCDIMEKSKYFVLSKRGLSLSQQDKEQRKELAYISYTRRNWKDWFSGIVL